MSTEQPNRTPVQPASSRSPRSPRPKRHRSPANQVRHDDLPLGARIADRVTAVFGSWGFILIQSALIILWHAEAVDAVVGEESTVLRGHQGLGEQRRHLTAWIGGAMRGGGGVYSRFGIAHSRREQHQSCNGQRTAEQQADQCDQCPATPPAARSTAALPIQADLAPRRDNLGW